jgi:NAD(P)-dependent dehydrogenase (short-subunit alcohol dehydrogenase family)
MAAIVAARASAPGGAAVSTIAAFHSHASPSRALTLASSSIGGARRYHHASACCFATKPTAPTAAELVDQDPATATQEAAKPRRKRRSRKAKKSATAAKEEDGTDDEPVAAAAAAAAAAAEDEAKRKKKDAPSAEESARALVAGLDDVIVNPVGLGRRSRQVFDEVWRKFSRLGQISSASSTALAEEEQAVLIRGGPMCEFTVPGAQDTTVLVIGATSRIGRIVVRKLMLRGYNVKVSMS